MSTKQSPVDTGFSRISFLDQNIAMIEIQDGIEVDAKMAKSVYEAIDASLDGDYSVIFNRNHSYSIIPKDVYQVMNNRDRLKAVAIVTYNTISKTVAESESIFCKRSFNRFSAVCDAEQWIRDSVY